ncbi:MAG TPA: 4-hydroxy-3-methylbut-2-enyl diphosphate reductase [Porphyromonadaceae bacterium]|nr:4-hydroxy-3-methylbut-2-enyl diphosphate reductase [Porphyromonadaceae bacterium]
MKVEIDNDSGFCFGVVTAIRKAEEELQKSGTLYCLGDIVHNSDEVQRLSSKGLKIITHSEMEELSGVKVLLRAHGEPPSTYLTARRNGIEIIDATCPVVLRLQQRIKDTFSTPASERPQIVIYGKNGHAEVNGLVGQTAGEAIVIESAGDLDRIDFSRDVALYSQTTKSLEGFRHVTEEIRRRLQPGCRLESFDTICRQVANRVEKLQRFARAHDVVLFVAGKKSSNGKVLYANCLEVNPATYLISNPSELDPEWLRGAGSVGICGATSTPRWLMEQVKHSITSHCPATEEN